MCSLTSSWSMYVPYYRVSFRSVALLYRRKLQWNEKELVERMEKSCNMHHFQFSNCGLEGTENSLENAGRSNKTLTHILIFTVWRKKSITDRGIARGRRGPFEGTFLWRTWTYVWCSWRGEHGKDFSAPSHALETQLQTTARHERAQSLRHNLGLFPSP